MRFGTPLNFLLVDYKRLPAKPATRVNGPVRFGEARVTTAREYASAPPGCAFFALYSSRNATTGFSRTARSVGGSAANKHPNIKPRSGKTTVAA